MPPRGFGHEANAGDHLGQDGVGGHEFLAFAIGVRVAGAVVTGGIDEKERPHGAEIIEEEVKAGVIERPARQRDKRMASPPQFAGEGPPNVSTCA